MATQDIVQKLWSLCDILRDDGITYHEYVTELTLLLFLKMAKETGNEEKRIPEKLRWDSLVKLNGMNLYNHYKQVLLDLSQVKDKLISSIYQDATTNIKQPRHLEQLISQIDKLEWHDAKEDGLGNLYEGLLEKNANETKSGAGQYFTPRPLIDAIVEVVQPKPGELIIDPAAGTGGFLIASDSYIKKKTSGLFDLETDKQEFQKKKAFLGMELVADTHRLSLMNCMLHDIEGGKEGPILLGNTLGDDGKRLPLADVILTNPPFGTKKGGGIPTRTFLHPTSNKQLLFLQHIYNSLKPNGRSAVVMPDNVLFEDGTGKKVRADIMNKCNLHTILRLPTGIFYAQGVKTNVLFFTRGITDEGNTKDIWLYDLRTNMPSFGKRTEFSLEHLKPFIKAYGSDPYGKAKRKDEGENGRFRVFSRKYVLEERKDNLDISWLKDESAEDGENLPEPTEITEEIGNIFRFSVGKLKELEKELRNRF